MESEKIMKEKDKKIIPINAFSIDKILNLETPILFDMVYKCNMYHLSNKTFEIYTEAETLKETILNVQDQLGLLWKIYVDCDKKELTDGAIDLRNFLIKNMKIKKD